MFFLACLPVKEASVPLLAVQGLTTLTTRALPALFLEEAISGFSTPHTRQFSVVEMGFLAQPGYPTHSDG